MTLTVHSRPCYLLETAELVFSFVNDLPARALTAPGEYCIPEEEALRIRQEICRDLDPTDKQLQYFFQGFRLEDGSSRLSNLATTMLYSCVFALPSDVREMKQQLLEFWASIKPPYCISAADPFALSFDHAQSSEFSSLSEEMNKVPVPMVYQIRLVEVFSQYARYLDLLTDLLEPLARRLEPLLEPWVLRAQPLVHQWEQYFRDPENVRRFFINRVSGFHCEHLELALRYFPAEIGYYRVVSQEKDTPDQASLLPGLGMKPGCDRASASPALDDREITALRLISNPDRLAMLQAMTRRPMGGNELADELGLNSGTVFRDLNNLATAQLITRDVQGRKSVYRTNTEMLRRLMNRILHVVDPSESEL